VPERKAQVWYEDQLVGSLREDAHHELNFTYDNGWLTSEDAFPISISLPFSDQELYAHPFFSGLLPEANVRARICREKGIDQRDDAGLLFAIGEDCAGALSIVSEHLDHNHEVPEQLTTEEIKSLARSKGELTLGSQAERRFSLAGAQEKQSVIFHEDDKYALPNRHFPSTHILKFETYPRVCFAEVIANQMASRIGLRVVGTEFLHDQSSEELPFLRIKRYDRLLDTDNRVRRLHQEDVLQAIGDPTALKYEADGGPGLAKVAEVLRDTVADPASSILQLRDWQMFNFLVGNWDGHAKNIALLYQHGSDVPVLAPFYDLVAIEFLNVLKRGQWSRKLAFRIGDQDVPERVGVDDWRKFSADLSIPERPTLERLEELAESLPEVARQARSEFANVHGDEQVYDEVDRYIGKRCNWVKAQLLK